MSSTASLARALTAAPRGPRGRALADALAAALVGCSERQMDAAWRLLDEPAQRALLAGFDRAIKAAKARQRANRHAWLDGALAGIAGLPLDADGPEAAA